MVGKVQYENMAVTELEVATSIGDTSIKVMNADVFPTLNECDYMYITVDLEVLRIDDVSLSDRVLTLNPAEHPLGIQGIHPATSYVELRMTKQLLNAAGDMGEF